ncbi:TSUP family transporter [Chitinophaga sp. SYP-B3965]|uniref:sulfite exporter TauE/SafE family protein n=1 Tax=Chitinophaga sp. SYP-B3965 TaxID=2663120 RepID=UPI0012997F9D|nr:sulfite exporter TauE/SafE family protein [Chitinophaga sp. SYP-B3965]MRG47418.1 TSUP family transporter [Chitinophaga sp. SYP-B3965]
MDALNALLLVGLGFFIGTFGTLIGAGGGFILMPLLLLMYPDMSPDVLTSISLAVVFLNASSGSIAYARKKRIDYRSALIFALATLPGAIIGAFTTTLLSRHIFNIILGALLIVVAIFLMLKPQQGGYAMRGLKGRCVDRCVTERNGDEHRFSFNIWTGIWISFVVGFISSLLGIGGGIIHVPALISLLNFPIHVATATSHLILAIMALAGTIVHMIQGSFWEGWQTALAIGSGVVIGAQLGAGLSSKVKPKGIILALAGALLIVGVRLILT